MGVYPNAVPGPPPGTPDPATVIDRVRAAADGVAELDDLPVAEHVARFDAVHAALTDALSSVDKV
ncbi:MAG TPA: hypothetical protein VG756_30135 [Pseudonocardiaceae bacterium]|nr:hypothetical protein [Pseudonocardiaceae bacterium]